MSFYLCLKSNFFHFIWLSNGWEKWFFELDILSWNYWKVIKLISTFAQRNLSTFTNWSTFCMNFLRSFDGKSQILIFKKLLDLKKEENELVLNYLALLEKFTPNNLEFQNIGLFKAFIIGLPSPLSKRMVKKNFKMLEEAWKYAHSKHFLNSNPSSQQLSAVNKDSPTNSINKISKDESYSQNQTKKKRLLEDSN